MSENDNDQCPICDDEYVKTHRVHHTDQSSPSLRSDYTACVDNNEGYKFEIIYVHKPIA